MTHRTLVPGSFDDNFKHPNTIQHTPVNYFFILRIHLAYLSLGQTAHQSTLL
jgi:hypothetical protein